MLEHELQNALISWLEIQGLYVLRVNAGILCDARTGTFIHLAKKGHPDLICSRPDKTIGFIEVKSKSGSLNMDQITTLRALDAKGLAWCVADDIEDVDRWIHDPQYHGKERHMRAFRDKFAYSAVPCRKKSKLTSNQMLEFELFHRDRDRL